MTRARTVGLLIAALAMGHAHEAYADDRVSACADAAERGQELRDAHKLVEARAQLVACAQRDCPGVVRESCTEWLADLDRRTPSVVVGVKDEEGRDIPGATVSLDGAPLPATVTSSAVAVNPGAHVMRYAAAGYEPVEESVVLREGEPLRVLAGTLRRSRIGPLPPGPPGPAPGPARTVPILPLVLAGTSLLALSVFAYTGLSGASDYRRLEKECSPRCSSTDIDGVRSHFLVADVALVVAVVTGGAAVTLWLLHRPAPSTHAAHR
jgi:hypothetical protein